MDTYLHIARAPLPWRSAADLTECGKPIAEHRVVSRETATVWITAVGQQRAGLEICMTCANASGHWARALTEKAPSDAPGAT